MLRQSKKLLLRSFKGVVDLMLVFVARLRRADCEH